MSKTLKIVVCLILSGLSQMTIGLGNEALVICFGKGGHLAIENSNPDCRYGPFGKHGHFNFSSKVSLLDQDDSPGSLETNCIDLPVSIDEDQKVYSST